MEKDSKERWDSCELHVSDENVAFIFPSGRWILSEYVCQAKQKQMLFENILFMYIYVSVNNKYIISFFNVWKNIHSFDFA